MTTTLSWGRCHCGALRFEVLAEPGPEDKAHELIESTWHSRRGRL